MSQLTFVSVFHRMCVERPSGRTHPQATDRTPLGWKAGPEEDPRGTPTCAPQTFLLESVAVKQQKLDFLKGKVVVRVPSLCVSSLIIGDATALRAVWTQKRVEYSSWQRPCTPVASVRNPRPQRKISYS